MKIDSQRLVKMKSKSTRETKVEEESVKRIWNLGKAEEELEYFVKLDLDMLDNFVLRIRIYIIN